jgi:hypothetical protein
VACGVVEKQFLEKNLASTSICSSWKVENLGKGDYNFQEQNVSLAEKCRRGNIFNEL